MMASLLKTSLRANTPAPLSTNIALKQEYSGTINFGSLTIQPVTIFTGIEVTRNRDHRTLTLTRTRYLKRVSPNFQDEYSLNSSPVRTSRYERSVFDGLPTTM